MAPASPSPPTVRTAAAALAFLVLGVLAFALWLQEFRFERATPGGRERVAVYTRWGCVVKEVVLDEVRPIDDIRSTRDYRREMAGVLLERAVRRLTGR